MLSNKSKFYYKCLEEFRSHSFPYHFKNMNSVFYIVFFQSSFESYVCLQFKKCIFASSDSHGPKAFLMRFNLNWIFIDFFSPERKYSYLNKKKFYIGKKLGDNKCNFSFPVCNSYDSLKNNLMAIARPQKVVFWIRIWTLEFRTTSWPDRS